MVLEEVEKISASSFVKKKFFKKESRQPPIYHTTVFECLMVLNIFTQKASKVGRRDTAIQDKNWRLVFHC